MKSTRPESENERIFRKLRDSSLYRTYRKAFTKATGLPLAMQFAESGTWRTCLGTEDQNALCTELNAEPEGCAACHAAHHTLAEKTEDGIGSVTCPAGLRETGVPVKIGNSTPVVLRTGQVFHEKPTEANFRNLSLALREEGWTETEIKELHPVYFSGPVVDKERYRSTVTLLAAFAMQLSDLANRIMIDDRHAEPPTITKARQYIAANLQEPLALDTVANHVGVSSYYFCKIFKQATGMTLTEYVNRLRVEKAKHRLHNPDNRITEIAYDVGFQSISQFNRCFTKYAGTSPSRFRDSERVRTRHSERVGGAAVVDSM
jgi:AraC-like DNA-binding protein/ligand-binding sensor protein